MKGCSLVLLSGGMDSVTLLHYVVRRLKTPAVEAISFSYGQRHGRELGMARWQARAAGVARHEVVDLGAFGALVASGTALVRGGWAVPDLAEMDGAQRRQPPTYVPNRNMVFLSLAAAYAEARGIGTVYYGAQAQDAYGYWDCTPAFVAAMNRTLALNRGTVVTIRAPFVRMSKAEILKIGIELCVDYRHTWTCYRGRGRSCGTCPSCVERAKAFRKAGISDPQAGSARRNVSK